MKTIVLAAAAFVFAITSAAAGPLTVDLAKFAKEPGSKYPKCQVYRLADGTNYINKAKVNVSPNPRNCPADQYGGFTKGRLSRDGTKLSYDGKTCVLTPDGRCP